MMEQVIVVLMGNDLYLQVGLLIQSISCIGSILVASTSVWISLYIFNKSRPLFVIGNTELHIPEKDGQAIETVWVKLDIENKGSNDSFLKDPALVIYHHKWFFYHTVRRYELHFRPSEEHKELEPDARRVEVPGYDNTTFELAVEVKSHELDEFFRGNNHFYLILRTHRGSMKHFLDS